MTHTLHREGSVESLKKDFIVFVMPAQGYNVKGSKEKIQRFLNLARQFNPVNIGENRATGSLLQYSYDEIVDGVKDGCITLVVFDNAPAMYAFLKALKEEDLGLSVVVSGLLEETKKACCEAGLKPHTVNLSLGIHGKTELLPPKDVLEVETMCGHGMITAKLVTDLVEKIKKGITTPEKASELMCKLCICGAFNPTRSAELLREMAEKG